MDLVWLDSWVVSNIAKAVVGEITGATAEPYTRLLRLMEMLRDRAAVLCPETGQAPELQTRGPSAAEALGILTRVTGGIEAHYQHVVDQQVYRGMRAYAMSAAEIFLPWLDAFDDDPIDELRQKRPLIRVDLMLDEERRQLEQWKTELQPRLEAIRVANGLSRSSVQHRLSRQVVIELAGMADASVERLNTFMQKIARGDGSADDYLNVLDIGRRLTALRRYFSEAGRPAAGFDELVAYYRSDYYQYLPSTQIIAALYGFRLTRPDDSARRGDARDIEQIAAMLPYAKYVVVDAAMRDALVQVNMLSAFGAEAVTVAQLLERLDVLVRTPRRDRRTARRRRRTS